MVVFIFELRIRFRLISNFGRLLLDFRWFNYRQIFSLFPRNSFIIFCVLLLWLIDALFNLLHLFTVGLLRFLPFIVLLNRLNSVSSTNSCIFMKISSLRIIRKFILRNLLNIFLLDHCIFWAKVISSNRSRFGPFAWFFLLSRRLKKCFRSWIIKDLLIF